jgi:hypothetical protein
MEADMDRRDEDGRFQPPRRPRKFLIVLDNPRVRSDTGLIARAPAQMQASAPISSASTSPFARLPMVS